MPSQRTQAKRAKAQQRRRNKQRSRVRDTNAAWLLADGGVQTWLDTDGEANIQAAAGDNTAPTFELLAYRGGRMRPKGFYYDVVVDLAGVTILPGKRPSYLDHDPSKIVGHTTSISKADGRISAAGVVSGSGEAAREVVETSAKGFPWRSSIGGRIKQREFIEPGKSVQANGKTFRGPLIVVRSMDLAEISFVSLAGDDSARGKIAAAAAASLLQGLPVNFDAWLTAKGFEPSELTDDQREALQAAYDAEQLSDEVQQPTSKTKSKSKTTQPATVQASASVGDTAELPTADEYRAEIKAAALETRKRHARYEAIAKEHNVQTVVIEAGSDPVDLVAHAIEHDLSEAQTEVLAMRAARPVAGPAIHGTREISQQVQGESLEAALCLRGGLGEEIAASGVSEEAMDRASSRSMRSAGIQALMYSVIQAAGGYVRPGQVDNDFIRAAFQADRTLEASGNAMVSLGGILGNVANKSLLKAYKAVDSIIHDIAARATNSDFKAHTRYRLTGNAMLEEVGADGQIKTFNLGEESYSNKLKTVAKMVQLSRQMMINDDLGAFLELPRILGRGAALRLNKSVFELLLANPGNFFSTANKNLITGAGSALSIEALSAAEKLFLDLVDKEGDPVMVTPKTLLTSTANKVLAEQLYADKTVNETTTANKPKVNSNPHAGKFEPKYSPFLSNAKIEGANADKWFLFADPQDVPVMEVAYLNGNETPTLESSEADFDVLGMKWRSFWDLGVAMANPTGGVQNNGA